LIHEADSAQGAFQSALGRGDLDGAQNAKTRLAAIKKTRDDLPDLIAALSIRHQMVQGKYGEAFNQWQRAEGDVQYLLQHIPDLRRKLATARRRAGEYRIHNDSTSPEWLGGELQTCEGKYLVLMGEPFPAEVPAAA
jgi:uncharacterized protein with von Willebrand factor type A (vWA) domain